MLFGDLGNGVGTSDNERRRARHYRANELYLPTLSALVVRKVPSLDDADVAVLYFYGSAIKTLISYVEQGSVKREVLEELMDRERREYKAGLYNDLRRLCIVSIGLSLIHI